ncbi:MAG: tail fiber domain-containing protein [Planctomycetes bacterium]|nr:tail fiber domain-containing protein [Planctomycetota bacterium]
MIRCVAAVIWSGLLLVSQAAAQVTYTAPFRTIKASTGQPGGVNEASAPGLDDWSQSVSSSAGAGGAFASQASSLGAMGASLTLNANATGSTFASSVCSFSFVPAAAMSVQIVGEGDGDDVTFSLNGPGVSLSRVASESGSNWNLTAVLQAGQSYTFASSATDAGTMSAGFLQLSLTFAFVPVPQGRGFSYQGVLRDASGQPITTPTDMEFRLFFNPTMAGTQVGPTITANAVTPERGVLTRVLDFGDVFDGDALWLEVSVRNPAGSGSFAPVLPRTPIASVPYANDALRAAAADSAALAQSVPWSGVTGIPANVSGAFSPWSAAAGGIAYPGGRVGIGTSTPATALHVASGAVGTGWQVQLTNSAVAPTFESGMRLSDSGFFEITNRINGFTKFARLDSNGAWTAVSDERLKTDLTPFDGALDAVLRLRPVRFRWLGDGVSDFGFVAQQLRTVVPDAVVGDEAKGSLTVNYSKLSTVAIGAIQEQQEEIRALREENGKLKTALEQVVRRLERLEAERMAENVRR